MTTFLLPLTLYLERESPRHLSCSTASWLNALFRLGCPCLPYHRQAPAHPLLRRTPFQDASSNLVARLLASSVQMCWWILATEPDQSILFWLWAIYWSLRQPLDHGSLQAKLFTSEASLKPTGSYCQQSAFLRALSGWCFSEASCPLLLAIEGSALTAYQSLCYRL